MGNCLKTQLKGTVINDNLDVLGYIRVQVTVPTGASVTSSSFISIEMKNGGSIFLGNNKNVYNASGVSLGNKLTRDNGDGTLAFYLLDEGTYNLYIEKDYLLYITFMGTSSIISLNDLVYATNIEKLVFNNKNKVLGDISVLDELVNKNNVTEVSFKNTNNETKGNTSVFASYQSLNSLLIGDVINIYGDIAETIGRNIHITNFNFGGSKVTGSLESFIALQKISGRPFYTFAEGTLLWFEKGGGITFKGNTWTAQLNNSLSWSPNAINNIYTDIEFNGNETTINVGAKGNWSYVNQDKSKYTG